MAFFWNRKSDIGDKKMDIEVKLSDIQNHNHGDLVYLGHFFFTFEGFRGIIKVEEKELFIWIGIHIKNI